MMPNDLPPWEAVYQQVQRWLRAGVFEAVVRDLCVVLRLVDGRTARPSAAILDSRTLQSTPESGARGGYDGAKGKRGSKVRTAVDALGHLPALARHGSVLLPLRWVVERSCAWAACFRRLARDHERLLSTLAGLHFSVFATLMLRRFVEMIAQGV